MTRIAHIENDMSEKFGIPRQSGLVEDVISTIVFEEEFRNPDAVKGLDGYTYIWLIWAFDRSERENWSPTETRRKHAHGSIRDQISESSESHRLILRKTDRYRNV